MKDSSDKELIKSYLKGDEKSLETLVSRYLKPIFGFAYRCVGDVQSAEDITQETFLKTWKNLKKFDENKSFKTWIFAIAKNTSFDYLKKKKPMLFSQLKNADGKDNFVENIKDKALMPNEIAEQNNLKNCLDFGIKKISEKYGLVLNLYYMENLNFREIAEKLGESINTIKSRHRRGLALLKNELVTDNL